MDIKIIRNLRNKNYSHHYKKCNKWAKFQIDTDRK